MVSIIAQATFSSSGDNVLAALGVSWLHVNNEIKPLSFVAS